MTRGEQIRLARKSRGLSQDQLAKLAKIGRTALSDLERDKFSPSARTIKKLAGALALDDSFFYSDIESIPTESLDLEATPERTIILMCLEMIRDLSQQVQGLTGAITRLEHHLKLPPLAGKKGSKKTKESATYSRAALLETATQIYQSLRNH